MRMLCIVDFVTTFLFAISIQKWKLQSTVIKEPELMNKTKTKFFELGLTSLDCSFSASKVKAQKWGEHLFIQIMVSYLNSQI